MQTATVAPAKQSGTQSQWTVDAVEALFALPFTDLMFRAQTVHREHFDPTEVQLSTLLSIKTGGCSEDCGYCSQSARYETGVERGELLALDEVSTRRDGRQGRTAPRASAWAPPGADRRSATSNTVAGHGARR